MHGRRVIGVGDELQVAGGRKECKLLLPASTNHGGVALARHERDVGIGVEDEAIGRE